MKPTSRREQNRLDKRARILDAALVVFAEKGFTGASMDEIAAEAEVTKPTLYQYFKGKDALFRSMMVAHRDIMRQSIASARDGALADQLLAFAWSYARTVMRPEMLSLARLVIGEASRFPEIGRQYQAAGPDLVLADLTEFMLKQSDLGRLSLDDPECAAEHFWALILSGPRNRGLHDPEAKIDEETLRASIEQGLIAFLRAYSTSPDEDAARARRAFSRYR